MKKAITFLSGILVAIAGWIILQKFEIHGWEDLQLSSRDRFSGGSRLEPSSASVNLPPNRSAGSIRIATFNVQVFGDSKARKPNVMDILARIIRQFDVVAIQEVCSKSQDLMPNFLDLVNAGGRHYDYLIGPRLGRKESKEQYAFVYDMATVEVDRSQLYTVADPDDLLQWEPLVAWFRVRGPPPAQAFTFSLVDVHTDPEAGAQELAVLADVYRAVRNDGRQEDDVIILGNLNADFEHLGRLGQISGMTCAIRGLPTNTRGTHQYDNLVFHGPATAEYTGRSGVFDFLREYNLTLEEALEVSDHLPVWAEFSAYEGGQPGRLAVQPDSKTR